VDKIKTGANTGLAKVAVQCSADRFVVNQTFVLRINICGENRHLRQAAKRCLQCQKNRRNRHLLKKTQENKILNKTIYP